MSDSVSQAAEVTETSPATWPFDDRVTVMGREQHVLPYGGSVSAGDLLCTMAEEGLTCDNTATGAGFFVSRSRYEFH
ncbi:hypothetical protein [Oryzobacter terrae]|uniref:hypothetical protein n=1 Tax=Oryzobacter terrae TaxID=1620385 RepID=UPI00366B0B72